MKLNIATVCLLAMLGSAAFATPVPALRKRQSDKDEFEKVALSGAPDPNICKKTELNVAGDGTQKQVANCVSTQYGEIPAVNKMTSSLITEPKSGQKIKANTAFTVTLNMVNINTGFFDDPETEYYSFSQALDVQGLVMGHSHITIQKLDSLNKAPDAKTFAFFKGLNDPDVNGNLKVQVDEGLPKGLHRICSMSSSFAHTPLIMPVAQRGSQDDCIRVLVV
jgi:hypothetical protein